MCASSAWAVAATFTAKLCDEECILPSSYPQVELTLTGLIEKGDLAKLQEQYAGPAKLTCLNRIEPGRYVMMTTPDEYDAWQKTHKAQTSDTNQPAPNAAVKQCFNNAVPYQRGHLNGMLYIDSTGGDLNEAMAIGHWVRQYRLGVTARGSCASACIWVLASGLNRIVWPSTMLKIHRPFLTISEVGAAGRLRALLQQSKTYFDEMGVPPELAERIFSTPPDEAKSLTREQVSYYRLDQLDMGLQEELDFARAKSLGITREEYTKRMQIYNAWNSRSPCPFDEKDTRAYGKCLDERARRVGILQ